MSFPAAWHPLRHVGAPRGDGSRAAPRADAEVRGALRGGQSAHRAAHHPVLLAIQCGHVRRLPPHTPATSQPHAAARRGVGQRAVPSRHAAASIFHEAAAGALVCLSAALQPGVEPDRTRLEAHAKTVYPQPILPPARRPSHRRVSPTGTVAKAQLSPLQIMRHYISRYV